MTRYEIDVDANTNDAVATLLNDARRADVTFTNVEIANPNNFGVVTVTFDANDIDVTRYVEFFDIDDDVITLA